MIVILLQSQAQILLNTISSSEKVALTTLFELLENNERTLFDVLETMPQNSVIADNVIKAWSKINSPLYEGKTIICAVSGGSDSDIVMDICTRCDIEHRIVYVFCNTGLESAATLRHLSFLEDKYGVEIMRKRPAKPVPTAVREYGIPFISKTVSEYMERLQEYDFKWEDEPLEVLLERYCQRATAEEIINGAKGYARVGDSYYRGCVSALQWWCNAKRENGRLPSMFDIDHNPGLKQFIIKNHPTFKISNKCCKYAKKDIVKEMISEIDCAMSITGVRKAEGGARATAYKNCFTEHVDNADQYRPIFWYSDADKKEYKDHCGVQNSDCYDSYGMKRTGCVGCPCALGFEKELETFNRFEPNLYHAVNKVFGLSYEYTRAYREFQKQLKELKAS